MFRHHCLVTVALALAPMACWAQGVTQDRSGLGSGSNTQAAQMPSNSAPAGSINAETGPQSRPAYPSGSTTPNPGEAFVKTTPIPATGPANASTGAISTTTIGPSGTQTTPGATAVGEAATPPR